MYIVLLYKENEIWLEPAFFETPERFQEITIILSEKYGNRLLDVSFDKRHQGSATWLFGDNLSGPSIVNRARKNIRRRYYRRRRRIEKENKESN